MKTTVYICTMSNSTQLRIANALLSTGFFCGADDIEIAMNGRLCDLEEIISIDEIMEGVE